MLKILIADDQVIIRKGLKLLIQEEITSVKTEEAADTHELIDKALNREWDIIISDISMPGGGGLAALSKIKQKKSSLPVLIISMHTEEEYAIEAFQKGASGFVNKDSGPDEFINAIKKILAGNRYISPEFAKKLTKGQIKRAGLLPHEL